MKTPDEIRNERLDEETRLVKHQRFVWRANGKKVGRNAPCFCGSGKKFKHCHLLKAPQPVL